MQQVRIHVVVLSLSFQIDETPLAFLTDQRYFNA